MYFIVKFYVLNCCDYFEGGGTGFIGSCLCQLLRRSGYDVVTISRHQQNHEKYITWVSIKCEW